MSFNNQVYQHNKESDMLKRIEKYCADNELRFKDVHDDYSTGIDIWIGRRCYDIKASESKKLTILKTLPNGTTYKPHETHLDVPYLYCLPSTGYCYRINKQEIIDYIKFLKSTGKLDIFLSEYTGDGNKNICIDIGQLLFMKEPYIKLSGDNPWNILNFKLA